MPKEADLNALLDRAKELKEVGEKLIMQSGQLMQEYKALKAKKQSKAQMTAAQSPRTPLVASPMNEKLESADIILVLLKQLESTLLGLQQLRPYIGKGVGAQILELLITEAETKISEINSHNLLQ